MTFRNLLEEQSRNTRNRRKREEPPLGRTVGAEMSLRKNRRRKEPAGSGRTAGTVTRKEPPPGKEPAEEKSAGRKILGEDRKEASEMENPMGRGEESSWKKRNPREGREPVKSDTGITTRRSFPRGRPGGNILNSSEKENKSETVSESFFEEKSGSCGR